MSKPVHKIHSTLKNTELCAERLKALSDPLRLKIVSALQQGEMTVGDLAFTLEVEIVTMSHHLQILKHADLIESHKEGRYVYYALEKSIGEKVKKSKNLFIDLGCCRIEV
jgi:DNA-binding transcriptional ArsR family regulator